ncbi:hypothetical protein A6g_16460 [Bacillus velezensis]|nr:hypothetical protein A6g_16460 [Bacillus velezensis]
MRKTPSFLVFLLFYYRRMDILRKNKGCRDFLDSLRLFRQSSFFYGREKGGAIITRSAGSYIVTGRFV